MIKIEIKKETREVFLDKNWLGNDNENLQETLEFSFKDEFVNGQARLELQFGDNGDKTFITLDKVDETYTTPVTNIMTVKGKLWLQLVITEGTNEEQISIFKSNRFFVWVDESINAETGDREPYIEWIDRANIKLNEIDNLDINAEKVDTTTTITITKKDGTQEETEILDGVSLNYNWSGTNLGIKRENEQNYEYVNLKGDKGDAGAIKMTIVNELPEIGADDTIYLVLIQDPETGNNYDEYIYVNNAWEKLGGVQVEVDLSDYYTKQEVNALIPDELSDLADDSTHRLVTDTEKTTWNGKQNALTFDNTPTANSDNPVKSGGIKTYVDGLVGDINIVLDAINGEVI